LRLKQAKNGDRPYKPLLLKGREEFVHGPGRVLQSLPLVLGGRGDYGGCYVEQVRNELVRVPGFYAVGGQGVPRKVAQLVGHDDIRGAADGGCKNVAVVRVRKGFRHP